MSKPLIGQYWEFDSEAIAMPTDSTEPGAKPTRRLRDYLTCLFFVIAAIVLTFPGLIGSNDDPAYALAVCFLGLAVVFWSIPGMRNQGIGNKQSDD